MSLIVCHACDLVHRFDKISAHSRVRCVRCRAELYRTQGGNIDMPIAWAASSLVLFIVANAYPLVALKINGATRVATLLGAAFSLYQQGYAALAALVTFTTAVVPLMQILVHLYVLVPLRSGHRAPGDGLLLRALSTFRPWAMAEVFMLGALVALVKLGALADVIPQIALVSYGLLMLTLAALIASTPTEQLWQWVERGCR